MLKLKAPVPEGADLAAACRRQFGAYVMACRGDKKQHLMSLKPMVEAAYNSYVMSAPFVSKLPALFSVGTRDGDRLFHCYQSGGGVDRDILTEVGRVSVEYCPYCGLRMRQKPGSQSPDRDHFLPRSVFPEFSILSVNLVQCCDDCNSVKGARFKDASGSDLFLHPYFDRVLEMRVLLAQAVVVRGTLQFVFRVDEPTIAESDRQRVRRHVDSLGVLDRMADEAQHQLPRVVNALGFGGASIENMRDGLHKLAARELRDRPNDPIGLALEAVGRMNDFQDVLRLLCVSQKSL